MTTKKTVLVTGYAKAPQGTSMYELYKHAGIIIEIDPDSNRIVDTEFTFVTDLAKRFLHDMLVGFDLEEGTDRLCDLVTSRYLAPSRHSVVSCIRVALQRYYDWRQNGDPNEMESPAADHCSGRYAESREGAGWLGAGAR